MKNRPTPSRSETKAKQLALRDAMTAWWEERAQLRAKRKAEQAKADAAARKNESRGVDRVPERLRAGRTTPPFEWVVLHSDTPRPHRRHVHLSSGRRMKPSNNQPHINPLRDRKGLKTGRLRKELQP